MFEPYFATKKYGHSGIGLSFCQQVIRSHGGEIRIDSNPGQGTAVSLHLLSRTAVDDRDHEHARNARFSSRVSSSDAMMLNRQPEVRTRMGMRAPFAEDMPRRGT